MRGTFYSKVYQEWLSAAKVLMRDACVKQNGGRLIEGDVTVEVTFSGFRADADIDNLCKSVLDAAQGMVFKDDKQVVGLVADKANLGEPITVVRIQERVLEGSTE